MAQTDFDVLIIGAGAAGLACAHELLAAGIEMGHVQKIIFKFRSRFWEAAMAEPITYMHAGPEFYFPTWWTFFPMRSPYLTAWQGGPKAKEMASWALEQRIDVALATLAKILRKSQSFLREQLIGTSSHDWSSDPMSRGAYSYVGIDGLPLARALKRPIENTLYFAGEGLAGGSDRGTVHGALKSGQSTARAILRGDG